MCDLECVTGHCFVNGRGLATGIEMDFLPLG